MKRLLAIALALVLSLSVFSVAFSEVEAETERNLIATARPPSALPSAARVQRRSTVWATAGFLRENRHFHEVLYVASTGGGRLFLEDPNHDSPAATRPT
jgi:hypothetical protein